jgi:site-specific recombinase XerD
MAEAVQHHLPRWAGRATPHASRHFAASDLYAQGMNVVAVQELLGHRWINATMIYVHVNKTHIEDAWISVGQRAASRFTGQPWTGALLDDDRIDPLDAWIHCRLANVRPEIREEALVWIRIVRHGGPRRRPRSTTTVRIQTSSAIPFLLACSQRYRALRQVSRGDVTEWLASCTAPHTEAVALRDLFKTLKSERLLFANPARGVSLGSRPSSVPTPLSPETIRRLTAAAETHPALSC